jgi:hypothetical protein
MRLFVFWILCRHRVGIWEPRQSISILFGDGCEARIADRQLARPATGCDGVQLATSMGTSPISARQYVTKLSPDGLRFLRKVHSGERDGVPLNRD